MWRCIRIIRCRFKNAKVESEVPLGGDGGVPEERLVAGGVAVIDEVVGELPLCAEADVLVKVIPQLGLGEDDQTAVVVGLLATPEINES